MIYTQEKGVVVVIFLSLGYIGYYIQGDEAYIR